MFVADKILYNKKTLTQNSQCPFCGAPDARKQCQRNVNEGYVFNMRNGNWYCSGYFVL